VSVWEIKEKYDMIKLKECIDIRRNGKIYESFADGEDHEVSMIQTSLDSIIKNATELKRKIGNYEKNIPAWIQDHVVNSENYIEQANSGYYSL
jgi:hypothetical protein